MEEGMEIHIQRQAAVSWKLLQLFVVLFQALWCIKLKKKLLFLFEPKKLGQFSKNLNHIMKLSCLNFLQWTLIYTYSITQNFYQLPRGCKRGGPCPALSSHLVQFPRHLLTSGAQALVPPIECLSFIPSQSFCSCCSLLPICPSPTSSHGLSLLVIQLPLRTCSSGSLSLKILSLVPLSWSYSMPLMFPFFFILATPEIV